MITLLVTNNSAVFRQLGSRAFQRLGIKYWVATSGAEAIEMARKERPSMALLDAALPDLDGYEVCRQIKADPALHGMRVMIVAGNVLTRADLERLGESGCDDVFCLPAPSEELYQHVARLLGFPYRASRRISVHLKVQLQNGMRMIEGRLINLSRTGARIGVAEKLGAVRELHIRLARSEHERAAVAKARMVWEREAAEGVGYTVGVEFQDVDPATQRIVDGLALYDLSPGDDGATIVAIQGDFCESTDFSDLIRHLVEAGRVEFDLAGVRYVNSWGVRCWVGLLEAMPPQASYSFVRCSTAFVMQAGMVPRVLGRGRILSLYAPYHCDRCDRSDERLLQTGSLGTDAQHRPPHFRCGECGGDLAFDDVPQRYFAFLTRSS